MTQKCRISSDFLTMKFGSHTLHTLLTSLLLFTCFTSGAKEIVYDSDTITVYRTFDDVLNYCPAALIIAPVIEVTTEWDVTIKGSKNHDSRTRKLLNDSTFAVCVGDSLWLVNGDWLKKHFHSKRYGKFMPFFFSDKIAYFTFCSDNVYRYANGTYFYYDFESNEYIEDYVRYHLIDVDNGMVELVDEEVIRRLLEDYPDMLRRYDSLGYHEHPYIINQFFEEYVQRLHQYQ